MFIYIVKNVSNNICTCFVSLAITSYGIVSIFVAAQKQPSEVKLICIDGVATSLMPTALSKCSVNTASYLTL